MTSIKICMVPELSNDYHHVLSFASPTAQENFFQSKRMYTLEQNIQADKFLETLNIPKPLSELKYCDYLYFTGSDNKNYYYFITAVEYLTQNTSKLTLELDIWSTYLFDFTLLPSYVERCHVPRWSNGKPTKELVAEPVGEFDKTIIHKETVANDKGCYIYASVNPLGKVNYRPTTGSGGGGGGSSDTGCGDPNLGIPSKDGFLFIKGFEGLAQYAHNIGDGVLTIGYGCTDAYDGANFTKLKANEPVSDELASVVFATSVTENYGIPLINQLDKDGVTVSNHEFDALLSFVYNAGLGSLTKSNFYASIKAGNKSLACEQWLTTNILPGSQFENGLRERRQAEVNIFKSASYDIRNTLIYGQGGSIVGTLDVLNSYVPDLILKTCEGGLFVNELTEDELGNVWQFPVKGVVSATFPTYPDGTTHSGLDIADNVNLKIRPAGEGVVYYVGTDASSGYGYHVVVEMKNGTRHWYGHMKTVPYVTVGQTVNPQTVLGIVGSTGNSTGPHVHWEIRTAPYAYDRTCWINPSPRTKLYDTITGVGD